MDALDGIVLALLGQVEVQHGGLESRMAHLSLHGPESDTGFAPMRGRAVAQGRNAASTFQDTSAWLGFAEGALVRGGDAWGRWRVAWAFAHGQWREKARWDGGVLSRSVASRLKALEGGGRSSPWPPCPDARGPCVVGRRWQKLGARVLRAVGVPSSRRWESTHGCARGWPC
jgi:hypothetical protein